MREIEIETVIALKAMAYSNREIALHLGRGPDYVRDIIKLPEVQDKLRELASRIREATRDKLEARLTEISLRALENVESTLEMPRTYEETLSDGTVVARSMPIQLLKHQDQVSLEILKNRLDAERQTKAVTLPEDLANALVKALARSDEAAKKHEVEDADYEVVGENGEIPSAAD